VRAKDLVLAERDACEGNFLGFSLQCTDNVTVAVACEEALKSLEQRMLGPLPRVNGGPGAPDFPALGARWAP
jgi:hypothetical protein